MKKDLSSNSLKLIAILAMTVDHFTWAVFPGCQKLWYVLCLHMIGRLTAPIMWFFLAEGAHYTRNMKKYILRLFSFAVVSHFAYAFAFGIPFLPFSKGVFNQTGVMWSLALAALTIAITRNPKVPEWAQYLAIMAACLLAFPSDWSSVAVMAPLMLYRHRGDFRKQCLDLALWSGVYAAVYFFFLDKAYGLLQMFTLLSIPLLCRYHGRRGTCKSMKWLFYLYYPAHLLLVGLLRLALHGNISIIFF